MTEPIFDDEFGICIDPCEHPSVNGGVCGVCGRLMEIVVFHGGVPGMRPGDPLVPGMAEHRYVEGCPDCEAQRKGLAGPTGDPPTPPEFVYGCTDRQYARYYASRAVQGWLYRVRLFEPEPSQEDPPQFGVWRARSGEVVSILDRGVTLTMQQRRRLFVRWGGTVRQFDEEILGYLHRAHR